LGGGDCNEAVSIGSGKEGERKRGNFLAGAGLKKEQRKQPPVFHAESRGGVVRLKKGGRGRIQSVLGEGQGQKIL